MNFDPSEYIRTAQFSPDNIDKRFRNARRILTEGIFVSHSSRDARRIFDDIVLPVLHQRFADGIFFHNRGSGGSDGYKQLVQAALHFCDKFIVAVSGNSISNLWVRAEANWAAEHRRPIIHCLLDDSDPFLLYSVPSLTELNTGQGNYRSVDFRSDVTMAQQTLGGAIDDLLARYPYRRLKSLPV